MKKIRLLLALFAASISSVQGAWARTAPTLPEAQTLESGKTYYLYNVGSDRFLSYNTGNGNGYPWALTDQGKAVKINLVNGTQYNIMFVEGSRYMYSYTSDIYLSDMHDENVIRSETGAICVVDCDIRINTPELRQGGTRRISNEMVFIP